MADAVGLVLIRDLLDEVPERLDAGLALTAAEDPGVMDVSGGAAR